MIVERKMIHDIVELIPESEIAKIYAVLNAYMSFENEETLTESQAARIKIGFDEIERGEFITAEDYILKRGIIHG